MLHKLLLWFHVFTNFSALAQCRRGPVSAEPVLPLPTSAPARAPHCQACGPSQGRITPCKKLRPPPPSPAIRCTASRSKPSSVPWRPAMAGPPWHGRFRRAASRWTRSEEHTSELQSPCNLVCRLLLEKKKKAYVH